MTTPVNIRSIQHFLYCPHRWGLIEIDTAWAENYYVAKADLLHSRVHSPDNYTSKNRNVFTSVQVWNDLPEYDLYGVVDSIEITENENGICINGSQTKYQLCIVEYKPTKPKSQNYNYDDALQVYAQKLCVDYIFGGDCTACIYYADVKKRIMIPFDTLYNDFESDLKQILFEIRNNIRYGIIPPIRKTQKCSGCSMKDLCMPKNKKCCSVRESIYKSMEVI